jgi:hypothetical protein
MHPYKRFVDCIAKHRIHSKARPFPVKRSTQSSQLVVNAVNVVIFPFKHFFNKLVAAELVSGDFAFTHQFLLNHDLGGDAGVIGTWNPQS